MWLVHYTIPRDEWQPYTAFYTETSLTGATIINVIKVPKWVTETCDATMTKGVLPPSRPPNY